MHCKQSSFIHNYQILFSVKYILLIFSGVMLLMLSCTDSSTVPRNMQRSAIPKANPQVLVDELDKPPSFDSHIQPLTSSLTTEQTLAQGLLFASEEFLQYAHDWQTKAPLRSEIFDIYPARQSDWLHHHLSDLESCQHDSCYRVDMYNYGNNSTTVGLVDIEREEIVSINNIPSSQPELNQRLRELAIKIAQESPEVMTALAEAGDSDAEPTMPNVKTALNETACERSRHLCVAPTFLLGEKALWAIVDLTEEQLVGVRWTELLPAGTSYYTGYPYPTERLIQEEPLAATVCKEFQPQEQNGWRMEYMLTKSDGLMVANVYFNNKLVLRSAKLVDWHVSYSTNEGYGYNDAIGCPLADSAAIVLAYKFPQIEPIVDGDSEVGFSIVQDFAMPMWPFPCSYRYEQRYEFYSDGSFRIVGGNLGRGCGTEGTYRPMLRIDIALDGDDGDSFAEWDGQGWQTWDREQWQLQSAESLYTAEGAQYKIVDQSGFGYSVSPSQGHFSNKAVSDDAYVYVVRHHADEGDADMVDFGSCCNTNHEQGPEQFIDTRPESISNSNIVIWYVPQIENNGSPGEEYCWAETKIVAGMPTHDIWPCYAGPTFVPLVNQ